MKSLTLIVLFLVPILFAAEDKFKEDVLVVVHPSVQVGPISRSDLLEIYTLRKDLWKDGSAVYIADYKGKSGIRSEFYEYLNIRINVIKRIWLKEQFTGNSLPPKVVEDADEMVTLISENPGTIGYIPRSSYSDNLKVIAEILIEE